VFCIDATLFFPLRKDTGRVNDGGRWNWCFLGA
jgi:hypothetical protein